MSSTRSSAVPPLEHSVPLTILVADVNENPVILPQEKEVAEETEPAMEIRLDGTDRCVSTLANAKEGTTVSMSACTSERPAEQQQFSFSTDGTIRLTDQKSLCIASDGAGGLQLEKCSAGVLSVCGGACCAKSCGACGGPGCEQRPGGGAACCGSSLPRVCEGLHGPPPCVSLWPYCQVESK